MAFASSAVTAMPPDVPASAASADHAKSPPSVTVEVNSLRSVSRWMSTMTAITLSHPRLSIRRACAHGALDAAKDSHIYDGLTDKLGLTEAEGDFDPEGEADPDGDKLGLTDRDGLVLADGEAEPDGEIEVDPDGLKLGDAEADVDGEAEALALGLGIAD